MIKKATREAYGEALVELGKINKDVVVATLTLLVLLKLVLSKKYFLKDI